MDLATIELHETMLRLAKGIVSARERYQHRHPAVPVPVVMADSPLVHVLNAPIEQLKASLGVWEQSIRLARTKVPAP